MHETNRFVGRKGSIIRMIALAFSVCMLIFSVVGGSLAWLITSTEPIVNVFTYGNIKITLEETTGDQYKMTPGKYLDKDPEITVKGGSEDCWLFVKIEESETEKLSDYIEYEIAEGWTALEDVPGVYYRTVDSTDEDAKFGVLKNDQVKVKGSVTKEMLEKLDDTNYPKLTITGYAVQRDANIAEIDTAAEAWQLAIGG